MGKNELNECCVCLGHGALRCAFGHSIDNAKIFWVECACGLRTTVCDSAEEAIKTWNWLNRSTPKAEEIVCKKQEKLAKIKESIDKDLAKKKELIDKRIKTNKKCISNDKLKENSNIKPKRHRRTKAEMQALRALENVDKRRA